MVKALVDLAKPTMSSGLNVFDDLEEMEKFEVNPLFYAHIVINQIIKAPQMAFINGQTESGLFCLVMGVDQLERVCRANGMVNEDEYISQVENEIKELVENENSDTKGMVLEAKKANIKLQYMLEKIFKKKVKRADLVL